MDNPESQYLLSLATQSPLIIVYVVGMILALMWMGRSPLAATLSLIGLVLLSFNIFAMSAAQVWLPQWMLDSTNLSRDGLRWLYFGLGGVRGLIEAAGMLLLVFAIFSGRPRGEIPYGTKHSP